MKKLITILLMSISVISEGQGITKQFGHGYKNVNGFRFGFMDGSDTLGYFRSVGLQMKKPILLNVWNTAGRPSSPVAGMIGFNSDSATIEWFGSSWTVPRAGGGTVTSFVFTDGAGLDGTVTNSTTTPTLSIIPSFSGLVASESNAFAAAIMGNLLEYNTGTIGFDDVYMTPGSSNTLVLKARMKRTSYTPADADFSTLSSRQEGLYELPDITANRTFTLFSGSGVDGQEIYIYNANTSGSFNWSFTGITPQKASDGSSVTTMVNGVLYHLLGVYIGSTPHWVIVNQ
jgi:hypothetical protein